MAPALTTPPAALEVCPLTLAVAGMEAGCFSHWPLHMLFPLAGITLPSIHPYFPRNLPLQPDSCFPVIQPHMGVVLQGTFLAPPPLCAHITGTSSVPASADA